MFVFLCVVVGGVDFVSDKQCPSSLRNKHIFLRVFFLKSNKARSQRKPLQMEASVRKEINKETKWLGPEPPRRTNSKF